MAKKYLSLEEAAGQLGISTDQLKRFRELGDIRGFADRGSWKFREQDIEEFLRTRQADSSPDFPIINTSDSSSSVLDAPEADDLSSSDSDVRLFFDDSMFQDENDASGLANSGSDLRLTGDSGPTLEADSPEAEEDDALDFSGWSDDAPLSDSDSDVQLVGAGTEAEIESPLESPAEVPNDADIDVLHADEATLNFSDSDSDVRLSDDVSPTDDDDAYDLNFTGSDSDSDVKLMSSDDLLVDAFDSDSDVKLSADPDQTDSDIRLAEPDEADEYDDPNARTIVFPIVPEDSDLKLIHKGSGVRPPMDSGISLDVHGSGIGLDADESGISLEIDSGISLEADDSGISLEGFDSGAHLGGDSGISLEGFDSSAMLTDDSGISLDAGDSGISLDIDDDSGISIASDDMGRTMPMQAIPGGKKILSDSAAMTTQFEIPAQAAGRDSEFELAGLDDDDEEVGTNTSVLTFEDDDDDDDLESSRTVAAPALSASIVDDEVEDEVASDDEYDDEESVDDDDVHDAEDFNDDDFESGGSQTGGLTGAAPVRQRADVDWGVGVKILIGLSTMLSLLCAVMGIELIRTMWLWTQPGSESTPSAVLQMVGGMF